MEKRIYSGVAPRQWPGMTVAIIASGPSLAIEDVAAIGRAQTAGRIRTIVINDTYRCAPWADVLYACDPPWWDRNSGATGFAGQRWTQDADTARRWGLNYVPGVYAPGISESPDLIHYGGNSGYQAINLAAHFTGGGARILLTGFDMQAGPSGERRHHRHGTGTGHPVYRNWIENFETMRPALDRLGLEVVNCSRATAIPATTFRRGDLQTELRR